ncbi:hypothetical protein LBP97_23215 [Serratia marcescens]|nr:hypothetical protein LBP97_23215 [Serratia marcescens]
MPLSDFTAALVSEGFGKTTTAEGYTMAIYHAEKNNLPMCGQSGQIGGFYSCTISPKGWNQLPVELKCKKCITKLKAKKAATAK